MRKEEFYPDEMERAYDPTSDEVLNLRHQMDSLKDYLIRLRDLRDKIKVDYETAKDERTRSALAVELTETNEKINQGRVNYSELLDKRRRLESQLNLEDSTIAGHESESHDD